MLPNQNRILTTQPHPIQLRPQKIYNIKDATYEDMQLIIKIPKTPKIKIHRENHTDTPIENNKHFIKLIEHFADYKHIRTERDDRSDTLLWF
jgi:hypothetical protein